MNCRILKLLSKIYLLFAIYSIYYPLQANNQNTWESCFNPTTIKFIENRGQITDQNYLQRQDVLFTGSSKNMVFHLTSTGVSYQFYKNANNSLTKINTCNDLINSREKQTIYRLDISWNTTNTSTRVSGGRVNPELTNYYLNNANNGIVNVKSYKEVLYENLYNGIQLKWYEKGGELEYDYLVSAGANYKQINMRIDGANKIVINPSGNLMIHTPLGILEQQAPKVIQGAKTIPAKWVIENNTISFNITGIDPNMDFVIDPVVRQWGSFFGGAQQDTPGRCATDTNGNFYICGSTSSSSLIATSGAHQTTYLSQTDAFFAKFTTSGQLLWSTYAGGTASDGISAIKIEPNGNVIVAGGSASSAANFITTGSHQTGLSGSSDAFIAKFNNSGGLIWGTYFGGSGIEGGSDCVLDASGNIYLVGVTNTQIGGIATPGAHQSTLSGNYDSYIAKFNSAGTLIWGTYYGGGGDEDYISCSTDANGNVFISGRTNSTFSISTPNSHQSNHGWGTTDGFLAKFSSNGVIQWGTYYGGANQDLAFDNECDANGNVYLSGQTRSNQAISTPGSHQPNYSAPIYSAYLAKFNTLGVRQWATYYGINGGNTDFTCLKIDASNNVYVSGVTNSSLGIATTGAYQTTTNGGADGLLVKFDPSGNRIWGTYYGDTKDENAKYFDIDLAGNIFICGLAQSTTGFTSGVLATFGSHQTSYSGSIDLILAKFSDCPILPPAPANITLPSNLIACSGSSTSIQASGSGMLYWYYQSSGGLAFFSGSLLTIPIVSVNTTYYVEDFTCGSSPRTSITVSMAPMPVLYFNQNTTICQGSTLNLNAQGALNYTWLPSGSTSPLIPLSPSVTSNYTLIGESVNGCSASLPFQLVVNPLPSLTVSSHPSVLCDNQSFTINALGALNYSLNSSPFSGNIIVILPYSLQSGVHTVIGKDVNNCVVTKSISLQINNSPTLSVSGSTQICVGEKLLLTASGSDTYLWNGQAGSSTFTFIPTQATTVTAVGINANSCSSTFFHAIESDACLNTIDLVDEAPFSLYPNPCSKVIHLLNYTDGEFELTNLTGQLVLRLKISSGFNQIQIDELSKGVYVAFIKLGTSCKQMKLVIE